MIGAVLLVLATAPAAFGADRAYWANGNDTISYANLDGSGGGGQLNLSGATPSGPRGVAVDPVAGRIYWANQGNDTISYANLDGSGGGGQLNVAGATIVKPHGVAIDPAAGRIYWANDTGNPISYAKLDGSGGGQLDTHRGDAGRALRRGDRHGGGEDLLGQPGHRHDLLRQARRIGRRRAQHLRVDAGQAPRRDDRPDGGADLLGQPRQHDLLRQPGRIGRRRRAQPLRRRPRRPRRHGDRPGGRADLLGQPRQRRRSPSPGSTDRVRAASSTSPGRPRAIPASWPWSRRRAPARLPAISGGTAIGSVLSCSQPSWAPDLPGAFLYRAPQALAYRWSRDGADIAGAPATRLHRVRHGRVPLPRDRFQPSRRHVAGQRSPRRHGTGGGGRRR